MFRTFDEKAFRQAINDKDFFRLKISMVSAMLGDPTFEHGEAEYVLKTLEEQVPEIFEKYVKLGYEEELERSAWDKRYFTKLVYWFQENFAKERVPYIKEVGQVVHRDTAEQYKRSMMQEETSKVRSKETKVQRTENGNFPIARVILAVVALVIVVRLLFKALLG